jgi:hypothetical protein
MGNVKKGSFLLTANALFAGSKIWVKDIGHKSEIDA